jgi:hypothetical protein
VNDSGRTDGKTTHKQLLQKLTALRKRVAELEETQTEFEQQGGNRMKRLLLGTMLCALVSVVPIPTMAASVTIALPPPIVFNAPPQLIVIPETYV